MTKRQTISFRKDNEWVYNLVKEVVKTKKLLGIRTSFSYEMLRLISNHLREESYGVELDKRILRKE